LTAPEGGARGWRDWRAWLGLGPGATRWTGGSLLTQDNYLLLAAILVGVLSGLGAVAFIYALGAVYELFFGVVAAAFWFLGPSAIIILPALGGLVVGPLIARFAPEARGHGVPEVMTAVATRGGVIKGRVAVVKIIASAITIGSGGSAGQEGPMVQIGAAAASAAGQRLRVSPRHMRTFIACGAAGGLAAVFNAPIGGAIFALEVITGELTPAFGAVILASVSATVVSRSFFGNFPSFVVPGYDIVSSWEFLFYGVLGVIAGFVSVAFIRTLYGLEERFERWQFPDRLKPVVGGLLVGLIGRFLPQALGTGMPTIEAALWGHLGIGLLVALVAVKILATSLTLGSGGSGGVFGPSLYVGAMLGGAFGWAAEWLFPGLTAGSGAYAMVGMGALVGGTMLAPLTAIILLFEMTDDYRIILPVMEATVLAMVVTRMRIGESIYTLRLKRQNIPYYMSVELEKAHDILVGQAMRGNVPAVAPSTPLPEAAALASRAAAGALLVIGEEGRALGVVGLRQLSAALGGEDVPASVEQIMDSVEVAHALATDRLRDALARLGAIDGDALIVLPHPGARTAEGVVTRDDVMRVYEQVLRGNR
jgi:chloride channel protein, CIC family